MTETVEGKVSSTQLVNIDPVQYVAAAVAPFKDRLAIAAKSLKKVTYDVTTKAGMDTAKSLRKVGRDIRISGDNTRKELKAPFIETGRLLDSGFKEIEDAAREIEDFHDAKIKAEEQRIEAEKAARIREQELRNAAIREAINAIIEAPTKAISLNAVQTLELLEKVKATEINKEAFGEQDVEAENAKYKAVDALTQLHESKVAQEAAAKAEQERQAREGAERAEQFRVDGIKARIGTIEKAVANAAMADTSAEVQGIINQVESTVVDASFAEFQNEAEGTKTRALKALTRSLNMLLDDESKAADEALAAQTQAEEPAQESTPEDPAPVVQEQPAVAELTTQTSNVQHFAGATRRGPTREEIVDAVASHFKLNNDTAEKLLVQTFQMAKAA